MTSGGVITAPVSISDVRSTLGLSSTALMDIVSKAKVGGRNGRAFTTVEGGGTINEGYLIDGAEPFWNKWSNESPGEWVAPASVDGPLRLRIKRDAGGGRYAAMLGTFRGYNHNSSAPIVGGGTYEYVAVGGTTQFSTTLKPRTGSYNWTKVAGATLFQARVYDGSALIAQSTPTAIADMATIVLSFTISLQSVYTKVYTTKLYIGTGTTNDFNSIGYIPITDTITIVVKPKPVLSASVYVNGNWRAFSVADGTAVSSLNQVRYVGTYQDRWGIETDGKILKRMVYTWGDSGSLTVTSFNSSEGPSYLRSYPPSDNKETFTSITTRVPGDYKNSFSVAFYYE
jgi:hypothetical protein